MPGIRGPHGAPGKDGVDGFKGEPGLPGYGRDGLPGLKGEPGFPGRDGLPGLQGQKGDAGVRGFPGLKGDMVQFFSYLKIIVDMNEKFTQIIRVHMAHRENLEHLELMDYQVNGVTLDRQDRLASPVWMVKWELQVVQVLMVSKETVVFRVRTYTIESNFCFKLIND